MNTVTLAIEEPNSDKQNEVLIFLDTFFLYVYTAEASIKIIGLGLKSYFTDSWNILDFFIVLTAWISLKVQEGVNLTALRALRILRPLRSISSIQGLKVLILALVNSMKPLIVSMIVLLFFLCIFAIAGVHLWMGVFKYRCVDLGTGEIVGEEICGNF